MNKGPAMTKGEFFVIASYMGAFALAITVILAVVHGTSISILQGMEALVIMECALGLFLATLHYDSFDAKGISRKTRGNILLESLQGLVLYGSLLVGMVEGVQIVLHQPASSQWIIAGGILLLPLLVIEILLQKFAQQPKEYVLVLHNVYKN